MVEEKMAREKWGSLVWLGVAIFICIGSVRLTLGSFHNPGPGFVPFITGAILGILAFIVYLQSRWTRSPKETESPFFTNKNRAWKAALTLIALLAYAVGMEYLGFLVSTTIFLAFLLWAVEPQRWYIVIFGSALASVSAYSIFELVLKSPLPKGFFEF